MSTLKLEERFEVDSDPEQTLAFLLDPERLVQCVPGATFDRAEGDRRFHGTVTVKAGTLSIAYQGTIDLTQVDLVARRMRAEGVGREKGSAGRVKLTLDGQVDQAAGGRSSVLVRAEVKLAGKIVRLGRGLIESVSRQLFSDFASAVQAELRSEAMSAPPASGAATTPTPAARDGQPAAREIRALPLLLRSLWSWLRDLFGARR